VPEQRQQDKSGQKNCQKQRYAWVKTVTRLRME